MGLLRVGPSFFVWAQSRVYLKSSKKQKKIRRERKLRSAWLSFQCSWNVVPCKLFLQIEAITYHFNSHRSTAFPFSRERARKKWKRWTKPLGKLRYWWEWRLKTRNNKLQYWKTTIRSHLWMISIETAPCPPNRSLLRSQLLSVQLSRLCFVTYKILPMSFKIEVYMSLQFYYLLILFF